MKTKRTNPHISKLITAAAAVAVLLPMASVQAADRHASRNQFTVYADVLRAEPIYKQVVIREPREECWTEDETYIIQEGQSNQYHGSHKTHRSSNGGDALVGGVIGGVIGNQLGRKGGRDVRAGATVAGAIIGSVLANEARASNEGSHRRHRRHKPQRHRHNSGNQTVYGTRPVQRCKTVMENRYEQRIDGYKVTYEHRGRRFKTRTRRDPGPSIQLRIQVEPVASQ